MKTVINNLLEKVAALFWYIAIYVGSAIIMSIPIVGALGMAFSLSDRYDLSDEATTGLLILLMPLHTVVCGTLYYYTRG